MTEALRVVIDFAFRQLGQHRIQAEVFPENTASLRVLDKLGFQEEGLLRQHLYHQGTKEFNDVKLLAKLKVQE